MTTTRVLAATALSTTALAFASAAQAEDLTLCWAAWDPANALVELSKDFEARVVEMVGTVLNKMNVPTRDDIDSLKKSVDRLNKKAADLRLA